MQTTSKTKRAAALAAAALAAALAGCGGGGSDASSGAGPVSPTVPAPAPTPAPGVPAGTPVTLPAGSAAADLLGTINSQLTRCGYAAMQPVQDLQRAAQSHADYTKQNGFVIAHEQTPGRPGYTGRDHGERIRAAGGSAERAAAASEGVGGFGSPPRREVGTGLMAAPYHLADMLSGWTEIGVGTADDPDLQLMPAGTRQGVAVLVYGGSKRDGLQPGLVRTFPCEGSGSIPGQGGPETPDPAPDLGGRFGNGLVFDTVQTGSISVTSIELRDVLSGQTVPLRRLADNNVDPARVPWRAVYLPAQVLRDGSRYSVTASGQTWATRDRSGPATSWSRSFTFSTF